MTPREKVATAHSLAFSLAFSPRNRRWTRTNRAPSTEQEERAAAGRLRWQQKKPIAENTKIKELMKKAAETIVNKNMDNEITI